MEYLLKGIGCLMNCSRISCSWAASFFYHCQSPRFGLQTEVFHVWCSTCCTSLQSLQCFVAGKDLPVLSLGQTDQPVYAFYNSLYFPAYIQTIFCVVSYQMHYTVRLISPRFLQIFHKLASLYRSSSDFYFCFYRCSFLCMTWRQFGNPRQPKELLLCRKLQVLECAEPTSKIKH